MAETTLAPSPSSLVTYSVTEAAIAATREACAHLQATTPTGYEEVRLAIANIRETRVSVEKRRVELKADALAFGRAVDAEAKRLTTLLEAIEEPLKGKKAAVDDERARVKAEKEAAELRVIEERLRADREAAEAVERAANEAEEARSRAAREAEQARLDEERARLDAERRLFEQEQQQAADERRAAEERARVTREAEDARLKAQREALVEQQRAVQAEQDRLARIESDRLAALKADEEAAASAERDRLAEIARIERIEALKPDVDKLRMFATFIRSLPRPTLESEPSKAMLATTVAALSKVGADLDAAIAKAVA